jgi:hypothetical protein
LSHSPLIVSLQLARPEEEQVLILLLEALNISRKRTQFPDPALLPLFAELLSWVEALLAKS